MTPNNKLVHYKQQRIQSLVKNSDSYRFFNLLTGPDLLLKVEALLPESHRERQFPPTETLSMFLAQAMSEDRSCQKAVNTAGTARLDIDIEDTLQSLRSGHGRPALGGGLVLRLISRFGLVAFAPLGGRY